LHEITTKTETPEVEANIIRLNNLYNFDEIGVDDGGIGLGVYEHLKKDSPVKNIIIALNNAKRVIDENTKKKLLKEEMYYNLKALGERGELRLLDNDEIKASLRSIHLGENGKIAGQDAHIVEGLIRAAWCLKTKHLKLWVASKSQGVSI